MSFIRDLENLTAQIELAIENVPTYRSLLIEATKGLITIKLQAHDQAHNIEAKAPSAEEVIKEFTIGLESLRNTVAQQARYLKTQVEREEARLKTLRDMNPAPLVELAQVAKEI